MTWADRHNESEQFASEAELALRSGQADQARLLYSAAADAEEAALALLDPSRVRTLGISAVSAVALRYKAQQFEEAEAIAHNWLSRRALPAFAQTQLRELLQAVWSEGVRRKAGVGFVRGEVVVAVRGGEIVEGGAPLDLVVDKAQTVQALFYRTAELLRHLPLRKRGTPPRDIQETCRPWLFQTAPGSYQFAVALQEPRQRSLFPDDVGSQDVSTHFLKILRASVDDPDGELPRIVADPSYQATFLKLTRNLAPTGKTHDELEIRSADESRPITLGASSRSTITDALRRMRTAVGPDTVETAEEVVRGVLRAVHLDRDWIEVTVDDRHVRIEKIGDTVDDVIGPMVNRPVLVRAVRDATGHLFFRDIEAED